MAAAAHTPAERKTTNFGALVRKRKEGWVREMREEVTNIGPW